MTIHDEQPNAMQLIELSPESPLTLRAAGRELLLEYGRFVIAQPGAARFCFGSLEQEAARLPLSYQEQNGGCLVAFVNDAPAGFVAWRALTPTEHVVPDAWEMKRLWVRPSARGIGLGRMLTQAVIDRAAMARRRAIYLDTAPESMAAAYRMYTKLGFTLTTAFNDNPVENLAYMALFL